MKIIFLDFDGVLNNTSNWGIKLVNGVWEGGTIEPEKVARVNQIVDATAATVIISSNWRQGRTVEQLQTLLSDQGATFTIAGKTGSVPQQRWAQILTYLEKHGLIAAPYVIIDDWLEAGWGHSNHFVNTNPDVGLTDADVKQAIKVLNEV
jgi:hypothetical protein